MPMFIPDKMTTDEVITAREMLGLSMREMAMHLGMSERRYWDWEHGRGASAIGTRLILRMLEDHEAKSTSKAKSKAAKK